MTVAIIAALERELAPLVKGWNRAFFNQEGRRFRAYQKGAVVAVAGGIGPAAATIAARAVVAQYAPALLVSAGLAGALVPSLRVGSIVIPNTIVDAGTGQVYRLAQGEGVLVTAGAITEPKSKAELAAKFHAVAVDMEAAAVAAVACEATVEFRCIKAISDDADFDMPPLNKFVGSDGIFQTTRFMLWTALRPQYWSKTIALGRNSKHAANSLCSWLNKDLTRSLPSVAVAKIDRAELSKSK